MTDQIVAAADRLVDLWRACRADRDDASLLAASIGGDWYPLLIGDVLSVLTVGVVTVLQQLGHVDAVAAATPSTITVVDDGGVERVGALVVWWTDGVSAWMLPAGLPTPTLTPIPVRSLLTGTPDSIGDSHVTGTDLEAPLVPALVEMLRCVVADVHRRPQSPTHTQEDMP